MIDEISLTLYSVILGARARVARDHFEQGLIMYGISTSLVQRSLLFTALSFATFALGCEESPISEETARPYVDSWAGTVEQTLIDRTEGASIKRDLKKLTLDEAAKEKAQVHHDHPPYASLVAEVYEEEEFAPKLINHGALTPAGEAVWSALQELEDHVLNPRDYPVESVRSELDALAKLMAEHEDSDLSPDASEKDAMVMWLTERTPTEFELTPENHTALTDALLDSPKADRLNALLEDQKALAEKLARSSAKVEFLLAKSAARYSDEMRHFRERKIFIHPRQDDYYNDPEIRKPRPDKAKGHHIAGELWRRASAYAEDIYDAQKVPIRHRNIRASVRELRESEEPQKVVSALEPQQPQYRLLIKEFKRYRQIVADGGWEKVSPKNLKVGSDDPVVKDLKVRLKAEGYFPESGSIDTRYDEDLKKAVTDYQTTHQMPVKGTPYKMFWTSLNIPAEDRLDQIRLNVQRWRDTNVRHAEDEAYVFINVPDFHAEAWADQKRELRHRVIVGNNDRVFNEEKEEWVRANRTPVPLAAYIDRAIYNPFWNVTPRIRAEDILPEVKSWLADKYKAQSSLAKIKPLGLDDAPEDSASEDSSNDSAGSLMGNNTPQTDESEAVDDTTLTTGTGMTGSTTRSNPESTGHPFEGKPYFNPETQEIDPSTTDPENIPGWYAENNYEVMYAGKSWEYVRMTPGDHNALGFVKIIFPNLHDVYLHDTNARALFSRDIRAMSHGCMRLQDPLDFAEWLLRRDNLYEKNDIPKILKTGDYLPVFLDRQIPVFVEYYTVRVDDEGRANFLADIYNYDDSAHLPEPVVGRAAAP